MASVLRSVSVAAAIVFSVHGVSAAQQQGTTPQPRQPAAQQQPAQQQPAQQQPAQQQPAQRQAGQQQVAQQQPAQQPPPQQPVEGAPVTTQDYGPESQQPPPPNTVDVDELKEIDSANVALDAGMGSPIAYARASVVELGGTLALTHQSETTIFRIAPSVGYFVIDNIELTLFPELNISNVDGQTDVIVGGMLEPSYHVPFSDRLYGFLGVGFGLRYAEDPGVDFALRPRLGMDIMVGRSGILKPAAFLDIGANDGLNAGGFEAGFTVML
jgi:hypothetical protein